jgi:hypothetical protein
MSIYTLLSKSKTGSVLFCFVPLLLSSCTFFQKPVSVRHSPVKDTVAVYHFIVSANKRKGADTATTNSFIRESKTAYDWISKEAGLNGQHLVFKEHWPVNKDSNLRNTFTYKLPNNSLQKLIRINKIRAVTQKRTKTQPEKTELIDWNKALFDSIGKQVKDSTVAELIHDTYDLKISHNRNQLFVIHVLKASESKILGYHKPGKGVYIGSNKSRTIAHESVHYLGAPDLYIHRYWFGKKRRTVKKKLWSEIMDSGIPRTESCNFYYISNYTAYTLGWTDTLQKEYKPLLKQGFMARTFFFLSLLW